MSFSPDHPRIGEFLDHVQEQIIDAHTNQPPEDHMRSMTIQEAVELSLRYGARLDLSIDTGDGGFYGRVNTVVITSNDTEFTVLHQIQPITYDRVRSWQVDLQLRGERTT